MKKVIGFNFTKKDFRFAVLQWEKGQIPIIIEKNKITLPSTMNWDSVDDLMYWFETQLELIIDKHRPDVISHKISITLNTLDQIKFSCYPQAILNLIAKKRSIPIKSFSSQWINASKFGMPKKTDVFEHTTAVLWEHPPYWDKAMKEAVLVAWFNII